MTRVLEASVSIGNHSYHVQFSKWKNLKTPYKYPNVAEYLPETGE